MLTVKDLEEFENYMRSGELETDFKDGCENDRYYLLELLEKFMDVAELADETATKVIFRGQIGLLAGAGAAPVGTALTDPFSTSTSNCLPLSDT